MGWYLILGIQVPIAIAGFATAALGAGGTGVAVPWFVASAAAFTVHAALLLPLVPKLKPYRALASGAIFDGAACLFFGLAALNHGVPSAYAQDKLLAFGPFVAATVIFGGARWLKRGPNDNQ